MGSEMCIRDSLGGPVAVARLPFFFLCSFVAVSFRVAGGCHASLIRPRLPANGRAAVDARRPCGRQHLLRAGGAPSADTSQERRTRVRLLSSAGIAVAVLQVAVPPTCTTHSGGGASRSCTSTVPRTELVVVDLPALRHGCSNVQSLQYHAHILTNFQLRSSGSCCAGV